MRLIVVSIGALLILWAYSLSGSYRGEPTLRELAGHYHLRPGAAARFPGEMTLTVRQDGTYLQTWTRPAKKTIRAKGNWSYDCSWVCLENAVSPELDRGDLAVCDVCLGARRTRGGVVLSVDEDLEFVGD